MDHMLRLGNFMMNRSRGRRERYREIIRSQTTIHVIRVEVLMLRTVHQSGEHSPVHRGDADDEELLGEERIKVVSSHHIQVD